MPAGDIQNIIDQIDQYVTQYAVTAFQNQRLRTILLNMCQQILSAQGGSTVSTSLPLQVTSVNFTDATNCPLTAYAGKNPQVYWNDTNRFLIQGTDWTPLSGGGFQILIPGFDSTTTNATFYVFS